MLTLTAVFGWRSMWWVEFLMTFAAAYLIAPDPRGSPTWRQAVLAHPPI
jgi:hypothetical protein